MAGDNPKPSALDNDAEDPYYDYYSEEDLLKVISSPDHNLMGLSFTQDPLPPPPPPPTTTTENINETELFQELSLSNSNYDTSDFLIPDYDDHGGSLSWDMFDIPSDDLNDSINNNVLEDIGNDNGNNVGESGRLEVGTLVYGEFGMNFETGGTSTMPVPAIGNDNGNNIGVSGTLEAGTLVYGEFGMNFETGGTSAMPVPAITPTVSEGILICTCCSLLRVLVHSNGQEMMRLDIYGGIGYFCHAILETQRFDGSNERRHQTYHLIDLNMEDVKKFIEDYCAGREAGGFIITQDTNADLYQAMDSCFRNNQSFMSMLPSRNDVPMSLVMPDAALNVPSVPQYVGLRDEPPVSKVKSRRKTRLAAQRERTGKLTLKDISMHFHLPIAQAARKLSLCPTVVKKICRRGGLNRWPHRRINSLLKKIESRKEVLRMATDVEVRMRVEQEIEILEKRINDSCSAILKNFQ